MMKVKHGDLDKLGLLFERYNHRLFGFFYRLTWHQDVSEDLVQGVFERILKYRSSYTNSGDFSIWVFSIARNHFHDYYRNNGKSNIEYPEVDWETVPDDQPTAGGQPPDAERYHILLQQALLQLHPDKRETLILSRFEGLTYTEIAEIMECSEGAVKVRIYRAIRELKEIIKDLKKEKDL